MYCVRDASQAFSFVIDSLLYGDAWMADKNISPSDDYGPHHEYN